MTGTKKLLNSIIAGIQDKKGSKIVVADLSKLGNSICSYFVICEGGSNTQINAIATSLKDFVKKETKERPLGMDGLDNCEWVVIDYGDIMVHIMQREPRRFYDIENLWQDAKLTEIADV
jgi:ribosome-associated protein